MTKPRLVAFLSDQQAPYFDSALHKLVLDWLDDNNPSEVIIGGDLFDFPGLSKHAAHAGYTATTEDSVESGHSLLADYKSAAPKKAKRRFIPGNHDQRTELYLWRHAERLAYLYGGGLRESVEKAGWSYVGKGYPHSMLTITPHLAAAHGWLVRKQAGMSALAHVEFLGHSVLIGHTHRQGISQRTQHELTGGLRVHKGVEAGCLCLPEDGLGYTVKPNWQPGFAAVHVYEDGMFETSLASYVNGVLLWQGQRWSRPGNVVDLSERKAA